MREHAHQLLDRLDAVRLAAVVHLLEAFLDDDADTLSSAEARAISEADEWSRLHKPIRHEQVLAEFGLTPSEWEKISRES